MPKPITIEMLTEMTPDQRKTLMQNAVALDTPAAREVIAMLSQDGMMDRPKPKAAAKTTPRAAPKARKPRGSAAATKPVRKPVAAQFGRQA